MALALAALLCFVSGFALASLGWSRASTSATLLLRVSLAVGYGIAIFSLTFFLWRIAGITHLKLADGVIAALLLVLWLWSRKKAVSPLDSISSADAGYPAWFRRTITVSFVVALAAALYSAVMRCLAHPHGDGWDAFSIWNLHARFLALKGPEWRDVFTPAIPWSHPDYPLLTPAAIAHFWSYLGRDAAYVPTAIGFAFTFATAGLLYATLSTLRGRVAAMLGGLALLATPSVIEQGTSQYADVPLSFFILATITLLCLHAEAYSDNNSRLLVSAGAAAGFAAWTKNEGLLFLGAVLAARILFFWSPKSEAPTEHIPRTLRNLWRASVPLALGALPLVLVIVIFKHWVAGPGDLFGAPGTIFRKLLEPARYWAVIQWYAKSFLRFGHWLWIPGTILLPGLYFATKRGRRERSSGFQVSRLALLVTLAGYFAIYLITPYDIYWHLRFSLGRLFLQLWPSAIFLFFLSMPEPVVPSK